LAAASKVAIGLAMTTEPSAAARPRQLAAWLLFVAGLVFAMVVIGGITRLTESGLSITEWKPLSGAIPPLTHADWEHALELYRATPQYREVTGPAGTDVSERRTVHSERVAATGLASRRTGLAAATAPVRPTTAIMPSVNKVIVLALLLAGCITRGIAYEGSTTTAHGNLYNAFLFTDSKAREPGDLITVIVMESAKASKEVSKKDSKNAATNVDLSIPGTSNKAKFGSDTKYAGGSSTERKGSLAAKVTVTVAEVFPNGNLRINGEQLITINKEKQILRVTGIVRPRDIDSDNTVLSSYIADAKIEYLGKEGRSGWIHWLGPIGWIYNWLF
jgi:flagellar basal body L-ring protein FlgH